MVNFESRANDSLRRGPRRRGVIGVMSRGSKLLLVRRAQGIPRGGIWCFPGGHVEPGETPRRAIIREFQEELGLTVRPQRRLGSVRLPDSGYVLAVWMVEHLEGHLHPSPDEIAEVRWMTPDELRALECGLPSNDKVLELMKAIG